MTPVVSVVMAAYKGAALVGETLASLAAQTMPDWEAIVVDDCSPDDTLATLRACPDPRVRVIAAAENGGPVRARNLAFAEARGRYIAGLDQDDLCRPDRFARQVSYLERHPDTALVGTAAAILREGEMLAAPHAPATTPALVEWLLHIENPLVWSSVMMRGDLARRLEPFERPERLYAEDFDLYHRLARLGRIARLDDELLVYRHHPGGASHLFTGRMLESAGAVLAEAYAPILDDAATAATLVTRHVMDQRPVPDAVTLANLGGVLARLQAHHLARCAPDAHDRRLIRWETARRWARIQRAALRTGSVGLAQAAASRTAHMGFGYAGPGELMWSRLIGGARQVIKRGAVRRARGTVAPR